ncbi:PLP-dependent aminotransferase family protein [Pseudomonas qingdaonensis]|nr:PLP-dependent aminotransferase family protein [Pseudomonas qingdaonensis]
MRWTCWCATWCTAATACWWTNRATTTCSSTCACRGPPAGVPRTRDGIDLDVLEAQIREHRPKVFFTNTRLQCPTGTSLTLAVAHRLLQLAEKYDFLIVENDIYADLDPSDQQALAGMDQLARVIYVASFSKSIAPSLRVGFVAAHRDLIDELVPLKMASGLTTSAIAEELALEVLLQGATASTSSSCRPTWPWPMNRWRASSRRWAWRSSSSPMRGCSCGPVTPGRRRHGTGHGRARTQDSARARATVHARCTGGAVAALQCGARAG